MRLAILSIGGERRIREPQMAEDTKAAAKAAKAPTSAEIERAREFAREPFLLEGEKPKDLAAGTPRRRALDAALTEIDEGREAPSIEWRRDFSLMLGLERLLSEEEPHLADGAQLDPHQVDALSGTLAALIADVQERINGHPWAGNGNSRAAATAPVEEEPQNGSETDGATALVEEEEEEEATEAEEAEDWAEQSDEDVVEEAPEDPGASRRFWFEHATGAGKTVAAVGFIEASRTGGILILTHRRNLVDQFIGEISDRGYKDRLSPPLLDGADHPYGPVTVETYQWFVRNASRVSDAYSIVVCDEAHTALGEKTSACIRRWPGPVFIGMTATGALIARHVADLFPTQTSRFDLAQAARRGVIAPLRDAGINARAVSGETPKRELAEILAAFERGEVDVLCNAMLLAEGWNSPRATICMHLAPTASRRVYQQRVGRVTRRNPGKESGLVIDFVHPATTHDETIVTLHSLLDRDVYRGGAIVVGPVRRGRGRRVRVEKRVVPVSDDANRRLRVLERELWRIAVENLNYSEQHAWAALAGARVTSGNWRRAKAMLQHDQAKELRRRFLLTCVQRNRNHQLRLKALGEIAALREAEAFDDSLEVVATWPRDERRAGAKALLQALAERRIGRRDQAQAWVWRLASITRELHEEYAVQRWPETKRLLGLFVNSSGRAHGRNARRIVHAARQQDRRLAISLLAASVAHTPEAEEVLRGARMRMARKPSAVARELLRNFPRSGGKRRSRRRKAGQRAQNGGGKG